MQTKREEGASPKQKLTELVRRSQQKQLETKKVAMLLVCKGAYCWSPLSLNLDDASSASIPATPAAPSPSPDNPDITGARHTIRADLRERAWLHVEGVRSFLESSHLSIAADVAFGAAGAAAVAGPAIAALLAAPPAPPPGPAGGPWAFPIGAAPGHAGVAFPPFLHPHHALLHPAAGAPAVNAQPHVTFHLACFAQPGEVYFFQSNLDIFWEDILATALPLEP